MHSSDPVESGGGVSHPGGAARSDAGGRGGSDRGGAAWSDAGAAGRTARSANARMTESTAVLRDACDVLASIDPADLSDAGLGDVLLDLLTVRRQVDGAIAAVGDRFAHSTEWAADGARDAVAWVQGRTQDGFGPARQVFVAGHEARVFEHMGQALRRGEVSRRHLSELVDVARAFPRLHNHLLLAQPQIVDLAREREPAAFRRQLMALCFRLDPHGAAEDAKGKEKEYYLHASTLMDGAVRVDGMLPADVGQLLVAALEAARRTVAKDTANGGDGESDESDGANIGVTRGGDSDGAQPGSGDRAGDEAGNSNSDGTEPELDIFGNPIQPTELDPVDSRLTGSRNIEALQRILTLATGVTGVTGGLDGALPSVAGSRPTINVTVSVETLTAEPGQGGVDCGWLEKFGVSTQPLTADTTRRLACDATLRPLIMDSDGNLVAFGTASRIIPPAMRSYVVRRDQHCRFAGCRARIDEVHHLIYYSRGGPTRSDNLIGLCWYHHHLVHEGGWHLTGDPNEDVTGTGPDGRTWTTGPPGR